MSLIFLKVPIEKLFHLIAGCGYVLFLVGKYVYTIIQRIRKGEDFEQEQDGYEFGLLFNLGNFFLGAISLGLLVYFLWWLFG